MGMIASSTIGKSVTGLAEGVPGGVAGMVGTVRERIPDLDVSAVADRLRDVDVAAVADRLRDVDVAAVADRLRDLPGVGSALPALPPRRSLAARVAVPLVVVGVAAGAVLVVRRRRARRSASPGQD